MLGEFIFPRWEEAAPSSCVSSLVSAKECQPKTVLVLLLGMATRHWRELTGTCQGHSGFGVSEDMIYFKVP